MTLTEGIATIRDRFQGYEADGIAFAEYEYKWGTYEMRRFCRITDIRVAPNDVLLVIDPEEEDNGLHMTVQDLLARLIALVPDYGRYSLEASKLVKDVSFRFDYPIVATARDDDLQLCFLVNANRGRGRSRKQRRSIWLRT